MARAAKDETYDVHPSIHMVQDWISTLKAKTGRSLEEWMVYINKEGPATEKERKAWLKDTLKLGTNTAWWLSERSVGKGDEEDTPEAYLKSAQIYVRDLYAGPKESLKQIHEALIKLSRSMGKDVKVCPCKTMTAIFREHVIAQIKPSTKTRIDFGLALGAMMKAGKTKFPARLIDTGGFAKKDRLTHRIEITSVDEIDEFVEKWLAQAYELDG